MAYDDDSDDDDDDDDDEDEYVGDDDYGDVVKCNVISDGDDVDQFLCCILYEDDIFEILPYLIMIIIITIISCVSYSIYICILGLI
jgi:hypothetical protein